MLRKSLLLTVCLCILSAPMAIAGEKRGEVPAPYAGEASSITFSSAMCTKGPNGSGEIIAWAKKEGQCRYSSNGQSWVENGIANHDYQHSRGH